MHIRSFLLLLLWLPALSLQGQANFEELLLSADMRFSPPEGMEEVALHENRQMNYEYAMKIPGKKFEARWAIRPLQPWLEDHEAAKQDSNQISIHPNELYRSLMMATVLNISGGKMTEIGDFPPAAVQREFGADWGATAFVPAGEEFGPGYDYVMMIALHKDDKADAYIFFLMTEELAEEAQDLMMPFFYALRFN